MGEKHKTGTKRYEPSVEVDRGKIVHTDWTYSALKAPCCQHHYDAHDLSGCILCGCTKRYTALRQTPDEPTALRIERLVKGRAFRKRLK